ncbi:hypothetical protein QWZ13_00890 [Reinekea marina]|uniref:hypothetical protein n=1 Tax=Reinekea marina TaxID=1310421 RepID=UPI0025B623D0|nr:hypothetical protein [Reinekea marina]MDN3647458.1 hypothetical protein [Reinekea marina]
MVWSFAEDILRITLHKDSMLDNFYLSIVEFLSKAKQGEYLADLIKRLISMNEMARQVDL